MSMPIHLAEKESEGRIFYNSMYPYCNISIIRYFLLSIDIIPFFFQGEEFAAFALRIADLYVKVIVYNKVNRKHFKRVAPLNAQSTVKLAHGQLGINHLVGVAILIIT